jgi:hypothetical protein
MVITIIFFFSSREMPTKEDYDINMPLSSFQAKRKKEGNGLLPLVPS